MLLLALAAGCASPTPADPAPRPTFTQAPYMSAMFATRSAEATETAAPTPTSTPTATATPTSTATPTPTDLPTPFAVVGATPVDGWRGPGPAYDSLGPAPTAQELVVLGRTADNTWLRVCCIRNQPAWVQATALTVTNSLLGAPAITPPVAPTPTATATLSPTATSTVTPSPAPTALPPFDIAQGPEFPWQVYNNLLTIMVKVYQGPPGNECSMSGYALKVSRDGTDVSKPTLSHGQLCAFDNTGPNLGNYLYNLKYEYPNAGQADWTIYLARPDGTRVSPITKFTTTGASAINLTVFIGYVLAR